MLNYEFDKLTSKKITPEIIKNYNLMIGNIGVGEKNENFVNYNLISLNIFSSNEIKKIETLFNLIQDPFLKQRLRVKNFEFILEKMDKLFFKNWEQFQSKMSDFASKKKNIINYKNKKKYIQECSLMSFSQEIMGLLNRIDMELFGAKLLSLHIEQMQKHLTLVDRWIQVIEDADLDNNEIHNNLLSFALKINMLTSESHLKLALPYWLKKMDVNLSKFHFHKGSELVRLSEQSINILKTLYKYSRPEYDIACYSFWVWKSVYDSQFIEGKHYVEKLIELLSQSTVIISHFVEPIIIYAEHLSLSKNRNLQEVIYYLETALNLLIKKEVYTEEIPVSRYQEFVSEAKALHEKIKEEYQNEIVFLLKRYDFFRSYQDDRLFLEINPSSNIHRVEKYFKNLPGVNTYQNKNCLEINKISLIATPTLKKIVSQIDRLLHVKPVEINPKKILINQSSLLSINPEKKEELHHEDEIPLLIEPIEISELNQASQSVGNELLVEKSVNDVVITKNKKEVVSDLTRDLSKKLHLKEDEKIESYGFKNELFNDANIEPLQGAKGIYIAYAPNDKLSQKCKKMDPQIDKRFKTLLNYPNKVTPKNRNGFKWVALDDDSVALIGKITRLPYRLFPEMKEINSKGETAYFYGTIQNTKRGKKSNQY